MPLRPADRRLAAFLVESDTFSLEALLPALSHAATRDEDLGQSLVRFQLLGAAEVDRLRDEAERVASSRAHHLDAAFGETLISEAPANTFKSARTESLARNTTPDGHEAVTQDEPIDGAVDTQEALSPLRNSDEIEIRIEPSHMERTIGDTEQQRYQLYGEIGRGGMGRILRVRDNLIGRQVAAKVMLEGAQASESDVRRFWMEVQATGQLEHPAIIPIHDVGRLPSGELFYVMKLLAGRTLAEILSGLKHGDRALIEEFTRTRLLTVFQQIAYAVAFSHARGVIHRDIKPANIMIGKYGEVTLLDWGLAKVRSRRSASDDENTEPRVRVPSHLSGSETADGTITGTPQYMSPEAVDGQTGLVTEKSDVYGLGAVLYEILTLHPAFADEGFMRTLVRVRGGDFAPPRSRAPERVITPELEEVCLLSMHRDPERRPTAKQLADDIGRILEGTRERERRLGEARARVKEGRAALERWRALREDLVAVDAKASRLAKEVPPWVPVEEKEPLWELEDRASHLKVEAVGAFEEAEAAFQRALGEVPDDREARGLLAALYYERFTESEKNRDVEGQRYFSSLVSRYDDGAWAKLLAGRGTLSVETDVAGVEVKLARLGPVSRVLQPIEERSLGHAPVRGFELAIGSYLLTLTPPAGRPVLRPVWIDRLEDVEVQVNLRSDTDVGADFVLVPGGPAIIGGDPVAHGALERRVIDVPEYAIGRYPVTCGEYLAFVNDLARRDMAAALRHVPRVKSDEGYYWHVDEKRRRFEFPPRVEGKMSWAPRYPVFGVSYDDALAYIAWRSARTGEKLRLPREEEWEKAARGVDGRFFPWGDHFDATFCKMKDSRNTYLEPEPVGTFVIDRSPYGAHDFAGGVRELCVTIDEFGVERPVMRGGCWHDTGLFCRVAFRHVTKPDFVNTGLGFRLVKDL